MSRVESLSEARGQSKAVLTFVVGAGFADLRHAHTGRHLGVSADGGVAQDDRVDRGVARANGDGPIDGHGEGKTRHESSGTAGGIDRLGGQYPPRKIGRVGGSERKVEVPGVDG